MKKNIIKIFFIIFLSLVSCGLFAYERTGPLSHVVQNPAYLWHISAVPRRATVLDKGELEFEVASDYSNIFERGQNSQYSFDMDMELWRLNLSGKRGMGKNFELFFEMPFYHTSSGFLDGFIQDFHRFFGFPNGGREYVKNNQFNYYIKKNGNYILKYSPVTFLPGDLKLGFAHQILTEKGFLPTLTFSFAFDLPTAPSDRGVGSGDIDYYFSLSLEKGYKWWAVYFNNTYSVFSIDDVQNDLVNQLAWQFDFTNEFIFSKHASLLIELVGGTPELKGINSDSWNGWPLDLIIGFAGNIKSKVGPWRWQIGFSEDVTSKGPSVDFTVFASITLRPGINKPTK